MKTETAWYRKKAPRQINRVRRGTVNLAPEAAIQHDFFQWIFAHETRFPELALFHSLPNEAKRSKIENHVMNLLGRRNGIPDLHLPEPRKGYKSLWIEMKSEKGNVTPAQAAFHEKLTAAGHLVEVHRSWITAANTVIDYLGLPLEQIK